MDTDRADPRWLVSLLTAAGTLALGWFAFVEERRVPLLGLVDLGVHELGHLLFERAPELVTAVMGNGLQTLMPLLACAYFALGRREPGTTHDWAYILGPEQLNALGQAPALASLAHDAGFVVLVAGLGTCLLPAVLRQVER